VLHCDVGFLNGLHCGQAFPSSGQFIATKQSQVTFYGKRQNAFERSCIFFVSEKEEN
jgi:hypothetical protein